MVFVASLSLADGNLVDADNLGARGADAPLLLAHAALAQLLDRMPIKQQLLGDFLDRARPASFAEVDRYALRAKGNLRFEFEPFSLPHLALPTGYPANLEHQVNPHPTVG